MTPKTFHIAMIDDDRNFLQVMAMALELEFKVTAFPDSESASSYFSRQLPDALLLDLHLEDANGFQVCQSLKKRFPTLPVFFLTSDVHSENVREGLKLGIDYFAKSMPPEELGVRVRARLENLPLDSILTCRNIVMNTASHEVTIDGKIVNFTPKEFDILKVFMEHQDELLPKLRILDYLWKDVRVEANNIDTHMFHMRKKFETTTGIECRKGSGYILRSCLE